MKNQVSGAPSRGIVRIIECIILGVFFGLLPPVFCLLATFPIGTILLGTEVFGPWVLWSLVPGVIIDVLFLKKWVRNAYQMNNKVLAGIYLLYSVVALGLGMGVPIFNLALGIGAGVYSARKMHLAGADKERRNRDFRKTALFCAAAMVMVCCLITLWAIAGQMIGSRFETPVLSFTFTVPVFSAVVLTGGAAVVALQYGLTRVSARITFILHTKELLAKIIVSVITLTVTAGGIWFAWQVLEAYHAYRLQAAQKAAQETEEASQQSQ